MFRLFIFVSSMYTNKNMWLIIRCHITNDDVILSDAHFVRLQAHFAYRRQHINNALYLLPC